MRKVSDNDKSEARMVSSDAEITSANNIPTDDDKDDDDNRG
jgi:hypothetical protein